MTIFQRYKIFQKIVVGVLVLFGGILAGAVVIAYSRPSGSTGLDNNYLLKVRQETQQKRLANNQGTP